VAAHCTAECEENGDSKKSFLFFNGHFASAWKRSKQQSSTVARIADRVWRFAIAVWLNMIGSAMKGLDKTMADV